MSNKKIFHVKKREIGKNEKSGEGKKGDTPIKNSQQPLVATAVMANVYGLNKPSTALWLSIKLFDQLYQEVGDTGLIYLKSDDESNSEPVLIDDLQHNPVSGKLQHVVFRRVNLKEKIETEIPVELVGENEVKDATVVVVLDAVMVSALPAELPEKFEVDISILTEVGQSISLADLKYDRSQVELILSGDTTEESPVVILQEVKEEVVEEEAPEEVEGAVEGEAEAPTQDGGEAGDGAGDAGDTGDAKNEAA